MKNNSIVINNKEYFALEIDSKDYIDLCKLIDALDTEENWEKYPELGSVYYALTTFAMIDRDRVVS